MGVLAENILVSGLWSMAAAWGFGVLFNLPKKGLGYAAALAFIGHAVRTVFTYYHWGGIVLGSLFGAITVGFVGAFFAERIKVPAIMYCVCAVIPMVPGYFSYLFFLYMIKMVITEQHEMVNTFMIESVLNGAKAFLIFIGLSVGVTLPLLWHISIKREENRQYLE
ncbi:MAG: threonine/serine exporter family protein [Cytophagales bacterium]|nr:threonine/serine exporter family protein [Cytophagales bacterium]